MSLALVGDRHKNYAPLRSPCSDSDMLQHLINCCIIIIIIITLPVTSNGCTFTPLLFFTAVVREGHGGMVLNNVRRGEQANPSSSGKTVVRPASICLCVRSWLATGRTSSHNKLCTNYPTLELHTFPPLLSLPAILFSCLKRTWWNGAKCKEDVKCFVKPFIYL